MKPFAPRSLRCLVGIFGLLAGCSQPAHEELPPGGCGVEDTAETAAVESARDHRERELADRDRLLAERAHYPAHWWAPVPLEGAPAWEILPQEAGPGEVILSKRHELGLLSNFAATPFELRGHRYASLEGFWQMMKYPEGPDDPRSAPGTTWTHTREEVAQMVSFAAHQAGVDAEANMQALGIPWITFEGQRIDWKGTQVDRHLALIEEATWAKVRQNPDVERALLSTGDLVLRPDHHQDADATPAWRYYDIYTRIRAQLQAAH
jgi:predicted NAD-dependent protein-ADP-ribosyltransferase YbiA (DUF1768 family)